MEELIKLLDEHLQYVSHDTLEDQIIFYVVSARDEVQCPYCGWMSARVHSNYERSFQDLPIQGKKVKVVIRNRKLFCENSDCAKTTFAESFDFLSPKAKKSKRLLQAIVDFSLRTSSVAASEQLRDGVVDIGKSTICNLLKKQSS